MLEEKMVYFFYYYGLFGNVQAAKRNSDTVTSPITIEEFVISKEEFDTWELSRLSAKYPCTKYPTLT